jgi:hypothetical protein
MNRDKSLFSKKKLNSLKKIIKNSPGNPVIT